MGAYLAYYYIPSLLLFLHIHLSNCDQQILSPQVRLRNATLDDADAITTVIFAAFSPLPLWEYLHPFREEFPEDYRECFREYIARIIAHPLGHGEVIEAPAGSDIPLVAAALWIQNKTQDQDLSRLGLMSSKHDTIFPPKYERTRRTYRVTR